MKKSKTFCPYPFLHMNFRLDRSTAPCFRSMPTSSFAQENMGWNSKAWRNLRKELLSEQKSEVCSSCWKLEEAGVESYRQIARSKDVNFSRWRNALDHYNHETGEMLVGPKQVELRFSNKCNLECRMCGPQFSSSWERTLKSDPVLNKKIESLGIHYADEYKVVNSDFLRQTEWLESIEQIMFAGGEPLIQDQHYEFLESISSRAGKITLDYSTNLSTLCYKGKDCIEYWRKFKKINLKVSLDGDSEIYSYIRKNGKFDKVVRNLQLLQNSSIADKMNIRASITVSAYNIERIIQLSSLITRLGVFFHTSQVQLPEILRSQVLPKERKINIASDVDHFLKNIENKLLDDFESHHFWKKKENRDNQILFIKKYLQESINYMMREDRSHSFLSFLKYDKVISKEKDQNIIDFYPQWYRYYSKRNSNIIGKFFDRFMKRLSP